MDRAHRLSSSREFRRVLDTGTRGSARTLTAFTVATGADGPARVGVTATKRLGTAVARNRAKRRLRTVARPCVERLRGAEVVLIAKPAALEASFQELESDLAAALRKAGMPC